jgi:glycosyltransferase involved in cell wall biosynthesis
LFLALQELVRNDQLRASIGEKGAETVRTKFNNAEQIKKLEDIYLRVIGRRVGPAAARR